MAWKFVVTNLGYQPLGELTDLFDVSVNRRLNGVDSMSFRVREDHPFLARLATSEAYVKAYRNGVLEFFGMVWTTEMVGEASKMSLSVNCISPATLLNTYTQFGQGITHTLYPTYSTQLFASWYGSAVSGGGPGGSDPVNDGATTLEEAKTRPTIGLNPSLNIGTPPAAQILYAIQDMETPTLMELLQTLSAGVLGFDWKFEPTEPRYWWTNGAMLWIPTEIPSNTASVPGNYYYATIADGSIAADLGTNRTSTVFDYQTGRYSLAGYRFTSTREYQINDIWNMQKNPTTLAPSATLAYDPASRLKWGHMHAYTQMEDKTTVGIEQILDAHLAQRTNPRRRIEITPRRYMGRPDDPPQFRTDFNLGDTITARIADSQGNMLLNGSVRVYAVQFEVSDTGAETVSLTITES